MTKSFSMQGKEIGASTENLQRTEEGKGEQAKATGDRDKERAKKMSYKLPGSSRI